MFGHHHRRHDHHEGGGRCETRRFARGSLRDRLFGEDRGPHRHGHRGGGRFFDQGELRLVVLRLIQLKPRHGYEIIKEIEERLGGAYSPSPGVIYPTLTLLEELGQVTVTPEDGGKKLHTITPEGERVLAEAGPQVDAIFARIDSAGGERASGSGLQVMRAVHNLRTALRMRMARGGLTEAQLAVIVTAIDNAAREVERA